MITERDLKWDGKIIIVRESGVDSVWDGKVKNLVYNTTTMEWEASTSSGGGEIGAEIDKHDLIKAIVEMVGNPTMLFTKQQLYDKIDYAMERIQANMQESTISVAGLKVPHE